MMLTYALEPAMLHPFLPPGCVLDLVDGRAFASLVAFDFLDTRVLGLRWPGFIHFPEINLRFYVRLGNDRGVCFIREFVPQRTVAAIARWFYNEPYFPAAMQSKIDRTVDTIHVQHRITFGGRSNSISVTAAATPVLPPADSIECFFKEHEWGFGTSRRGRLIRYQVVHPVWEIYPVTSFDLDWGWSAIYGPTWAPLQQMQPISVILAAGSAVQVFPRGRINIS